MRAAGPTTTIPAEAVFERRAADGSLIRVPPSKRMHKKFHKIDHQFLLNPAQSLSANATESQVAQVTFTI